MRNKKPPASVSRVLPKRQGVVKVSAGEAPPTPDATTPVRDVLRELTNRNLVGARGLKFGDLLASDQLRIVPAGVVDSLGSRNVVDVPAYLSASLANEPGRRFLVLAPPGVGKSTCSLLLYHALATRYISGDARPPLLLDLKLFRKDIANSEFGSRAWLDQECSARLATAEARKDLSLEISHPFLILDSLDEFFAGSDFDEFNDAASRHLFQYAHVIFCRAHFFEQAGRFAPAIAERDIISLQPWDSANVDQYVRALYAHLSPEDAASAHGFLDWIHSSPALNSVVQVPIRLNMALDIYRGPRDVRPREPTLLKLYEAYVSTGIRREQKHRLVGFDQMFRILMQIAWESYLEGGSGQATKPPLSETDVKAIIVDLTGLSEQNVTRVYDSIMNLGVLEFGIDPVISKDPEIQFSHKSFQEYLVATRVHLALTSSHADTARMFASHLAPEVSEFIKEAIDDTNTRPKQQAEASANFQQALKEYTSKVEIEDLGIQEDRFRFMKEQLCYYLGNLHLKEAHDFLLDHLEVEEDEWVRRGIAVGLAFGGIYEPLAQYLNDLAKERSGPSPHPRNEANIGFHLSFFGDQPFDPADPEKDFGFPECSKTVARLSYQLTTRTNRPNWQIDLYTLLDLRNRTLSLESYEQALAESVPALNMALRMLESDTAARDWNEAEHLRQLLDGMNPSGGGVRPDAQ